MKKYLEFDDGKSHKFWSIELDGDSFTVNYGKVGAAGQTQTKSFDSEEEAEKEATKLLNSKIKKGYAEAGAPTQSAAAKPASKAKAEAKPKAEKAKAEPKAKAAKAEAELEIGEDAKYYEFDDGKSHKFWSIELDGDSFTVNYGKVGTAGQTQTKSFDSDEEAEKEAVKLINSKTKKGYAEVKKN